MDRRYLVFDETQMRYIEVNENIVRISDAELKTMEAALLKFADDMLNS